MSLLYVAHSVAMVLTTDSGHLAAKDAGLILNVGAAHIYHSAGRRQVGLVLLH
jgi:hypothetical protein